MPECRFVKSTVFMLELRLKMAKSEPDDEYVCAIRAVGHLHDAAEDVRLRVQVGEVSSEAARLVDYIDVEHLAKLNDFEKKEIHFMQKQCGIPVTKLDAFASTYGRTSKSGSKL